jgi:hypothetical protein
MKLFWFFFEFAIKLENDKDWDQIIQYGKRIAHTNNKEPNMYYCENYYTCVLVNNVCALPKIVQYGIFTIYT